MTVNRKFGIDNFARYVTVAFMGCGVAWCGFSGLTQEKQIGDVADDFQLINVMTDETFRLSDLEGSIVVLDFFFYWCSICRGNSAVAEKQINQYYRDLGGNPEGLPVVLVGLEKDDSGMRSGETLFFAERTGLELVVDDSDHVALNQFFSPRRGEGTNNSDFVVLNGVPNSPSHQLWEIVYTRSFRPSVSELREAIDSIQAPVAAPEPEPAVPAVLSHPKYVDGRFQFRVEGTLNQSATVEVSTDTVQWNRLKEIVFGDTATIVIDENSFAEDLRFYRVVTN
ncbi:MAG: Thiol-disulfide oxidoreductase ResA [Verrucomicrobia subdivision 3 bacterium]|nr:Thiol-disulfide oxidoreductase ResA [Limisphaerales bacterium]MCS1414521.1 Thiol-disulfide oxidoreductase ResA [Limisphaerales bacterium]